MSRSGHFTLDNLPERYREQVREKLAPKPRPIVSQGGSATNKSNAPKKKSRSPIRMRKGEDGANKTEARFNQEVLMGLGKYEPITFHLAGGDYTPDYMFVDPDTKEMCFVEVKGSYRLGTHGRSVFAFKQASSDYPQFTFLFAELSHDNRTWIIETCKAGKQMGVVSGTAKELREM